MAKKNTNTNTINNDNVNVSIENNGNKVLFKDVDGSDTLIDFSDIKTLEKKIKDESFKYFVSLTSFNDACTSGKWNMPYIGLHEGNESSGMKEYFTVFYRETSINFKRFISEKYGKEELKELSKKYQKEIRICNAFLNHIAVDGEKVDVSDVKTALNDLNESELHIELKCTDDNDKEYILTCTNKMVRVKLVNDAKENVDVSGFKTVKITDMISVIVSGLSKIYHARNDA